MIGSEDYPNLLLIGSTNRKSAIDEAVLRPGR
jgi:SpoVK/Ycf46/Vps4 family AAA+-type ATPase